MCRKFTPDELNTMDHESKNDVIYQMQDRLDRLEHDYENLMEQVRLANQQRFGRNTEKLDEIAGQLSFFNEAEANCDENVPEPTIEETVASAMKPPRKHKKKGQREEDLKDFPQEEFFHDVPAEELDDAFGRGNWKSMPDETFWQLRFEPARWIAEKHVVKVYVGTDGLHQDEFLRGDHPATLFKGSIATPSLEAAVINAKYVNSNPLDRIARDFQANGLNLSKQTMSNWTVWSAERYFLPLYEWMKKRQLKAHVNQCDETPLEVIYDGRPAGSKSYMWVHLTGELSPVPKIIIYEYQKTRHSDHPKEYYKDFTGFLMTDGLEQYHKLERDLEGVTNANCMAHARRHFSNAIKAPGKTPAKEYVTVFAEKSSDWGGRLSLLSDNVWAEVNCTFAIDKKNLPLSILLKQEKKANGQIRWAIVGVSGLTEAGILEDRYITISPADHELNFMSFEDLFNSNASLTPGLRSASKDIDQLSMFFGLSYTGKLKFKSVEKLRYHFLDIPGYIFTVEASNRPEDVGGWRIADIMMAGEFDKMDYINSLYGYK